MPKVIVHDGTINYTDGGESKLLSIITDPSFDEQQTYRGYYKEWNLYYHLSPLRKNLFAWFDLPPSVSILELGAGCGMLTAYLAAKSSRVVAVEGSAARADIIAQRCRTCSNVEVHACDLLNFTGDEKFDIVTLVGVLEYAGKFRPGGKPRDMLLSARNRLKEKGTLLLAIENRIGHKYVAGLAEDHYGIPFEGINDYPHDNGVRTFDYHELKELLAACGFNSIDFFFPFPDYKLPYIVFSEAAFTTPPFDPLALLRLPSEDHVARKRPAFSEREFLRSLHHMGCEPFFMNSFLVFASPSLEPGLTIDRNLLATRLNTVRVPPFATRVVFYKKESSVHIKKERIGTGISGPYQEQCVLHNPEADNGVYLAGFTPLVEKLLDAMTHRDEPEIERILRLWVTTLSSKARSAEPADIEQFENLCRNVLGQPLYARGYEGLWIDGEHFDLPYNIMENGSKTETAVVDREWTFTIRLPLQLVFDRALFHLRTAIDEQSTYMVENRHPQFSLPPAVIRSLASEPLFMMHDAPACLLFEHWFQDFIRSTKRSFTPPPRAKRGFFQRDRNRSGK